MQLRRAVTIAALIALPLLAFAPGLTSPLIVYDDPLYIDRPEMVAAGSTGLASLWAGDSAWHGKFIEYFPLRDTVYWVIYQGWQRNPLPYHLASLFFHVVATLLVFSFLRQVGQTPWVATFAALLFAVHPSHVESVVWAATLKDPLYTCFMLGSLIFYVRHRASRHPLDWALTLVLLVGSLLVKSMAISTPLIMLAIERWLVPPTSWKTTSARLVAPVLICTLFLTQYLTIGRINGVPSVPHGGSWTSHWVLAGWAQVSYARQALIPSSFHLLYCFEPVTSLFDARFAAALVFLAALSIAVIAWRATPIRLFCLAFYFACLLPVSNLVPFPAVMADRYLYAASAGSCLLIALLLTELSARMRGPLAVGILLTLSVVTALRSSVWQDQERLFQDGDEDPTCLSDPEFPAAQVHFLRYQTAKTDETRLLALDRAIRTRGMKDDTFGLWCESLIRGALLAEATGDHLLAEQWSVRASRRCAWHSQLWSTLVKVNVHRNLERAAIAADKLFREQPTPGFDLLRVLTLLELRNDPEQQRALLRLVATSPTTACPALRDWSKEIGLFQRSALEDALASCLEQARP